MTEVPPVIEPRQPDKLPRLGPFPPPISDDEREQWETLCSVATTEGLCKEAAVDPDAPLRICGPHLGLAVMVAIDRLEAAEANDQKGEDHE